MDSNSLFRHKSKASNTTVDPISGMRKSAGLGLLASSSGTSVGRSVAESESRRSGVDMTRTSSKNTMDQAFASPLSCSDSATCKPP